MLGGFAARPQNTEKAFQKSCHAGEVALSDLAGPGGSGSMNHALPVGGSMDLEKPVLRLPVERFRILHRISAATGHELSITAATAAPSPGRRA